MTKSLDGLHPEFRRRVEALLADPEARGAGIFVVSAFRSVAQQRVLWEAALRKYGNPEIADNWVARPGQSNHGPKVPIERPHYGIAVDFGMPGVKAVSGQWPPAKEALMRRLGARYGLHSPMAWEDWHYEPVEGTRIKAQPAPIPHREDVPMDLTPGEKAELFSSLKRIEGALSTGNDENGAARGPIGGVVARTDAATSRQGRDLGWLKDSVQKVAEKVGATLRPQP